MSSPKSNPLFLHAENAVGVFPRLQAAVGRLRVAKLRFARSCPERQALIDQHLSCVYEHAEVSS